MLRRSSFFNTSAEKLLYSGNEPLYNKKAIIYGHDAYTWNNRFISLLDSFFTGNAIHNLADISNTTLEKFVAYANGTLSSSDTDYNVIKEYNTYLSTIQPQVIS